MGIQTVRVADGSRGIGNNSASSSNEAIGFNAINAREFYINLTKSWYKAIVYNKTQFEGVKNILRTEWIGPDEVTFEQLLIDRLNYLFDKCDELVAGTIASLATITDNWINFQSNNDNFGYYASLEGDQKNQYRGGKVKYDKIGDKRKLIDTLGDFGDIVSAANEAGVSSSTSVKATGTFGKWVKKYLKDKEYKNLVDGDESYILWKNDYPEYSPFRGLKSGMDSAKKIHDALDEFIKSVKSYVNGIFSQVDAKGAFFGTQLGVINGYVQETNNQVAILSTSIGDLDKALQQHTATNYNTFDTDTVSQAVSAAQKAMVDSNSNLTKNAKWN